MESGGCSDADAFGEDGLVLAVKLVAVAAVFDDETVVKMRHPVVVVRSNVGHPPNLCLPNAYGWEGDERY
jgi:hypothetical protein